MTWIWKEKKKEKGKEGKIGRRKRGLGSWKEIDECLRGASVSRGGEGRKSWKEIGGRREGGEKCVSGLKRGRKLDKMDDNRHFDSGGTQPSSKCMQRDLHLDALSIKSRVIRDHLGQEAHRFPNEPTNQPTNVTVTVTLCHRLIAFISRENFANSFVSYLLPSLPLRSGRGLN